MHMQGFFVTFLIHMCILSQWLYHADKIAVPYKLLYYTLESYPRPTGPARQNSLWRMVAFGESGGRHQSGQDLWLYLQYNTI